MFSIRSMPLISPLRVDIEVPTAAAIGDVVLEPLGALVVLDVGGVALRGGCRGSSRSRGSSAVHFQVDRRPPHAHAHRAAENVAVDHLRPAPAGVDRRVVDVFLLQGVPIQVADFQADQMHVLDAAQRERAVQMGLLTGCGGNDDRLAGRPGDLRRERDAARHVGVGLASGPS